MYMKNRDTVVTTIIRWSGFKDTVTLLGSLDRVVNAATAGADAGVSKLQTRQRHPCGRCWERRTVSEPHVLVHIQDLHAQVAAQTRLRHSTSNVYTAS